MDKIIAQKGIIAKKGWGKKALLLTLGYLASPVTDFSAIVTFSLLF
jgi:hypothetical protein